MGKPLMLGAELLQGSFLSFSSPRFYRWGIGEMGICVLLVSGISVRLGLSRYGRRIPIFPAKITLNIALTDISGWKSIDDKVTELKRSSRLPS
jgi:hypothetical protein